jgi:phthiocerol/phenolphthiocerol synthesis type-I polyketide synthase C
VTTGTPATGDADSDIAIVGMACRFPGAANPGEFWRNLRDGAESITQLSMRDMLDAGLQPAEASDKRRVAAAAMPVGVADFDAGFFGFSPREAKLMDPQQRLFLECAWEALEDAGHDPAGDVGATGVFAGTSMSTYLLYLVRPTGPSATPSADLQLLLGNDKDYLATQVAYKFGLRGPALSVQTACSTSLVAVHLACQSLLGHECDLALAGGVTVRLPAGTGYLYEKRGVQSPDGHCRPFDGAAQGTVFGSGAGVVVLKRLADALADGDIVDAVIRGSAVNNDGSLKAGFTAPSEDGQADVVAEALAVAGVEPATIGYVEAHGTGTPIGDPIEVAALARAFRARAGATGIPAASCALGAVKSNLGHLESAAGVAGLIKTVLALKHQEVPPTLHFTKPNPAIDFAATPFYVSSRLEPWPVGQAPRRAGVSSFGMGGTNAHVIVEQAPAPLVPERAPEPAAGAARDRPYLLPLSARNPGALAALARRYGEFLADGEPGECLDLADVCWSAGARRTHHAHRGAVAGRDRKELRAALSAVATATDEDSSVAARPVRSGKIVFVFPEQGSHWVGVGSRLMAGEPVFRAAVEQCDEAARRRLGCSPIAVLGDSDDAQRGPGDADAAALATFAVQTGLAVWWQAMGIGPDAVLGHGMGEVAAAYVAGALSLDDATDVMGRRAGLEMPAAVRASGPAGDTRPGPSAIEFISAATGEPVDGVRLDDSYWAEGPRDPARFTDAVQWLAEHGHEVFVEISPDPSLLPAIEASLLPLRRPVTTIASLRRDADEQRALRDGLAALYRVGRTIDWDRLYPHHAFVRLPTYPWQRRRCWVDPPQHSLPPVR